jgi:hypothetical protein
MSAQMGERSGVDLNEDGEQVDYEQDDDEQVSDEQIDVEQVPEEQVADEQASDKQVVEEQVADEQAAGVQAGKQVSQGPNSPNRHVRFEKGNDKEAHSPGNESAGSSDTSSKGEGRGSPLVCKRRKKTPFTAPSTRNGPPSKQTGTEARFGPAAARKAPKMRSYESASLEDLAASLPHPFPASPVSPQAIATVDRGDAVDQVPLIGPFVTEEEASNLAAAQEAQRAINAASEKKKRGLQQTRAGSVLTRSSSEKSKVVKKPTKGPPLKKTTASKKKKAQTPPREPTLPNSAQDTPTQELAPAEMAQAILRRRQRLLDERQDVSTDQGASATAEPAQLGNLTATTAPSPVSVTGTRTVVPIATSGPTPGHTPLAGPVPGGGGTTQATVAHAPLSQADILFQGHAAQLDRARTEVRNSRQQLTEEVAARAETKKVKDELTQAQDAREELSLASENALQREQIRLMDEVKTLEKKSSAESDALERPEASQSRMTADCAALETKHELSASALQAPRKQAREDTKK